MMKRTIVTGLLMLLLFVALVFAALLTGTYELSVQEVWHILIQQQSKHAFVIWQIRLPRMLLALCAGGILSLSGFYMQVLIRNPLADPYIMGLTSGAGLGVNVLVLGFLPWMMPLEIFAQPLAASLGSFVSLLLVMVLGYRSFFEDNAKLLIAGVAVASIFSALTGLLIYKFADSDQIRRIVFWTFGSLHAASWEAVLTSSIMLLVGLLFALFNTARLDVLMLGDLQAQTLGMHVSRMKFALLLVASIITGGVVAFTGPIGFVGMMIPHFSRALFGGKHWQHIFWGTLLGAIYLCFCDLASRWILPPAGLPIGIITAMLGVPFFLYVLFRGKI